AQAEEPVVLAHELRRGGVLGAQRPAVVSLVDERLAAGAVAALPGPAIQIAARIARAPQVLDRGAVARVARGLDEVVGLDGEQRPERAERRRVAVDERAGRQAFALGGGDVLEAVVVGAGRGSRVASAPAAMAR